MGRVLFSLQFRLILGFTLVLALALVGVSAYVGYAAQQESERFQRGVEENRAARIGQLVSEVYATRRSWADIQPAIRQAGSLYGWRIVVADQGDRVVGDSHMESADHGEMIERMLGQIGPRSRLFPVFSEGREVGSLMVTRGSDPLGFSFNTPVGDVDFVASGGFPEIPPEPSQSQLLSALNRSLLFTGLAAGVGAILVVSLVSRRVLTPVRSLSSAARRLGQGDLTQRVSPSTRGEIGDLSRTFNSMAEGLERAEQQRRNLMADVAHELRTPLTNVQGYLEAVKDGLLQPDVDTIETILQQVLYLTRLVEDLRLLALAEAGALRVEVEPDSLGDLLQRSVEAIRPRAQSRGVALSLDLPLVEMDRTRIAQVVGNLLENAIVHTPEGGQVTVVAVADARSARVTVADSGEGVPPEELSRIFERFHRADPSRSRATGGAGLGLTIAKQLVEAHGGTIRAESGPGPGSRFIFELPLSGTGSAA